MQYRETVLPDEWRTLQFAPFWVFLVVAGADGNLKERELRALTDLLAEMQDSDEPLVKAVSASVEKEFDDLVPSFALDSRSVGQGLADVSQIVEQRVSSEDSRAFRDALILIGHQIAEAEGSNILRRKIRTEEQATLNYVADCLNATIDDKLIQQYKRQNAFSRFIQWSMWITLPLSVPLMALGGVFLVVWTTLDSADSFEQVSFSLFMVGCLGAPVMASVGLVNRVVSRSSLTRVQKLLILWFIFGLPIACCLIPFIPLVIPLGF